MNQGAEETRLLSGLILICEAFDSKEIKVRCNKTEKQEESSGGRLVLAHLASIR